MNTYEIEVYKRNHGLVPFKFGPYSYRPTSKAIELAVAIAETLPEAQVNYIPPCHLVVVGADGETAAQISISPIDRWR
jgi:hypothetical protein